MIKQAIIKKQAFIMIKPVKLNQTTQIFSLIKNIFNNFLMIKRLDFRRKIVLWQLINPQMSVKEVTITIF